MKTGFDEIGRRWKWRGRHYLAGVIVGVMLGFWLGLGFSALTDITSKWSTLYFILLLGMQCVVLFISFAVEGKPVSPENHIGR